MPNNVSSITVKWKPIHNQRCLPEESRLHAIIRAYTIYALKPINEDILRWFRRDVYFRGL